MRLLKFIHDVFFRNRISFFVLVACPGRPNLGTFSLLLRLWEIMRKVMVTMGRSLSDISASSLNVCVQCSRDSFVIVYMFPVCRENVCGFRGPVLFKHSTFLFAPSVIVNTEDPSSILLWSTSARYGVPADPLRQRVTTQE